MNRKRRKVETSKSRKGQLSRGQLSVDRCGAARAGDVEAGFPVSSFQSPVMPRALQRGAGANGLLSMFRRFDVLTFQARRGFSMIELLISIMILGIGLVMVATIFPVGLDMTRETVQQSLGLAATDSALDIIKLKLPAWHDEMVNVHAWDPTATPPSWTRLPRHLDAYLAQRALVLPDDPLLTSLGIAPAAVGLENNASLQDPDEASYWRDTLLSPSDTVAASSPAWVCDLLYLTLNPSKIDTAKYVARSQAFTESTFWEGDPSDSINSSLSYVLAGQNVPVDYAARASRASFWAPVLMTEHPPAIREGLRYGPAPDNVPLRVPGRLSLTGARLSIDDSGAGGDGRLDTESSFACFQPRYTLGSSVSDCGAMCRTSNPLYSESSGLHGTARR